MPPPSAEYVGTWKSRDDSVRLVFTNDGKVQYTKGKWTNTGLIVAWNEAGFEISAYPKPEQHTVKGPPHEKDGYNWLTVDDAELVQKTGLDPFKQMGTPVEIINGVFGGKVKYEEAIQDLEAELFKQAS